MMIAIEMCDDEKGGGKGEEKRRESNPVTVTVK
jgi:hypothetical protein